MSLLKKIGRAVKGVAKTALSIKTGGLLGGSRGGAAMNMLPALPAIGSAAVRTLPAIGRVGGAVARTVGRVAGSRAGRAVGAAATGVAIYDAAGNFLGTRKKRRAINPMNWRALNRALRRVEKAKKAAKRINAVSIRKPKDC